jgi:hypothetical protein
MKELATQKATEIMKVRPRFFQAWTTEPKVDGLAADKRTSTAFSYFHQGIPRSFPTA